MKDRGWAGVPGAVRQLHRDASQSRSAGISASRMTAG